MEENNPETHQETPIQQNISLSDALAGVFAEPGSTFEEVKKSSKGNYWVWPIIILSLITTLASFMVLRDEDLSSEIKKTQLDAVKLKFDEAVKEGKMTREEANEQLEKTEKMFGGGIFTAIGLGGGFFGTYIIFFVLSLLYFLVFKIFKGTGTYVHFLNVLGISSIISSIQVIVNTVLSIFSGHLLANIGPVWLFTEDQLGKGLFKFIASFDVLTIWYLAVIAIGFARVSSLKTSITMPVVYGLWIIWIIITSFGKATFIGV